MGKFLALLILSITFAGVYAAASEDYCAEARKAPLRIGDRISVLYWSDADSGRANGVCFRLGDVDAAETGGVGSRGGAECEAERKLGFEAKAETIWRTKHRNVVVSGSNGFDRYNRQVVAFSVDSRDWATVGKELGIYKSWVFKNGKATHAKPDYCQQ